MRAVALVVAAGPFPFPSAGIPDPGAVADLDPNFCADQRDCDRLFAEVVVPTHQKVREMRPKNEVSIVDAGESCGSDALAPLIAGADRKLVILGAGPAGLTAALYAARAELQPLVLAADGGQLESTTWIDNFPGFPEGVDAGDLVTNLRKQAERFGAEFEHCTVEDVDLRCRPFKLTCSGETITTSSLIVAFGASAKWLGVRGEQELLARGVHTCATCDGYFYKGRECAVVGGGDTAMEQALFLARICRKVTIIHRRDAFRASRTMAVRALRHPVIDILWNSSVVEFQAGGASDLSHVVVTNHYDETELSVPVDGAFVAIGHLPNTGLFKSQMELSSDGYILTVPGSTRTSVVGVYAAGDAADSVYRQAVTSAGTGAMAALDAERWLCEHGC